MSVRDNTLLERKFRTMSNLTTAYIGTDEECPKCRRDGREDPSELTYVVGLVEPGVYQLICPKHGSLGEA